MPCTGTVVSILWGLHVVNRTPSSCYFSWKRCWLVFSYQRELSCFQVSKYIKYSAYKGCISLWILYCLITCNIKSLLNVPKISHISRKTSQVSRFPAKSPDSRNKFVFLPKQPLLELSPPVYIAIMNIALRWATHLDWIKFLAFFFLATVYILGVFNNNPMAEESKFLWATFICLQTDSHPKLKNCHAMYKKIVGWHHGSWPVTASAYCRPLHILY